MLSVDKMIDDILVREGGYTDHPADRGGATNFGITQKTLAGYLRRTVSKQDVKDLSEEVARDIYQRNYYIGPRVDQLPAVIQPFIFDGAVNHGSTRAIKMLQSVCNQAGCQPAVSEDGVMGPNTRHAAEWAENALGDIFLEALIEERRNFYLVIVEANPSQKVFLNGWMNRINEFERGIA